MKKGKTPTLLLCASSLLLIAAQNPEANAGFTQISSSSLKYNGVKYWRKKADEAMLGSVGEKKTPVGSKNYFQKIQNAPGDIYDVTISGETTISTEDAKTWGVTGAQSNAGFAPVGPGGKGSAGGTGKFKGQLTAYKMTIDLGNTSGDLRYETNRHISHLNALKGLGTRARLISAVWILVSGQEAKKECYSGSLQVSGSTWKVKTKASGCKSSTWTIPAGSVIAYEMVKVSKWDTDEIIKSTSCASGYSYEVKKSVVTPKDKCKKGSSTKDPYCPSGYDYKKNSTSNGGRDQCFLKGIEKLTVDTQDGF